VRAGLGADVHHLDQSSDEAAARRDTPAVALDAQEGVRDLVDRIDVIFS
jgi:hypothetical protein